MKTKEKTTRREWDDADIAWTSRGATFRVMVLGPNEFAPLHTSTVYDHTCHGPALLVVEESPMGTRVMEHNVNDRKTWQWISRMVRDGIHRYDPEARMLSSVDCTEVEVAQRVAQAG